MTIIQKDTEHTKIKGLNFDKEDFAKCGKNKKPLAASLKKMKLDNRIKNIVID